MLTNSEESFIMSSAAGWKPHKCYTSRDVGTFVDCRILKVWYRPNDLRIRFKYDHEYDTVFEKPVQPLKPQAVKPFHLVEHDPHGDMYWNVKGLVNRQLKPLPKHLAELDFVHSRRSGRHNEPEYLKRIVKRIRRVGNVPCDIMPSYTYPIVCPDHGKLVSSGHLDVRDRFFDLYPNPQAEKHHLAAQDTTAFDWLVRQLKAKAKKVKTAIQQDAKPQATLVASRVARIVDTYAEHYQPRDLQRVIRPFAESTHRSFATLYEALHNLGLHNANRCLKQLAGKDQDSKSIAFQKRHAVFWNSAKMKSVWTGLGTAEIIPPKTLLIRIRKMLHALQAFKKKYA